MKSKSKVNKEVKKTPLEKSEIKNLEKLGIAGCKSVEYAKAKLLDILKKKYKLSNEALADENLASLMETLSAFQDKGESETKEASPKKKEEKVTKKSSKKDSDEDDDGDDEAEEKTSKKKKLKVKNSSKEEKPSKKTSKEGKAEKPKRVKGERFSSKNKNHIKLMEPLKEKFANEEKFEFNVLKNAVSVFAIGKNSKKGMFKYKGLKVTGDGKVLGHVSIKTFKGEDLDTVQQIFGKSVTIVQKGKKFYMKDVELNNVAKAMSKNAINEMLERLNVLDKKLSKNREKLDKLVKGTDKKKVKKSSKEEVVKKKKKVSKK